MGNATCEKSSVTYVTSRPNLKPTFKHGSSNAVRAVISRNCP